MSEHDLSTMLRDHLSDEPPVGVRSEDAIRTGRRQSRVRLALVGGATAAVLAVAAATVPGIVSDDGQTTARETPGLSSQPGSSQPTGTFVDRLQAVAQDELGQYVQGGLGPADLFVTDVDVEDVPATSPDVQIVGVDYDRGDTVVHLGVSGFAPAEFEQLHLSAVCDPDAWQASCAQDNLADGSYVKTQVSAYAREAGVMRSLDQAEATAHPDKVFWGRSVQVSTPSGLEVMVAEYVRAPEVMDVAWSIPLPALRGVATGSTVLDATGVAHVPLCGSAHTTC